MSEHTVNTQQKTTETKKMSNTTATHNLANQELSNAHVSPNADPAQSTVRRRRRGAGLRSTGELSTTGKDAVSPSTEGQGPPRQEGVESAALAAAETEKKKRVRHRAKKSSADATQCAADVALNVEPTAQTGTAGEGEKKTASLNRRKATAPRGPTATETEKETGSAAVVPTALGGDKPPQNLQQQQPQQQEKKKNNKKTKSATERQRETESGGSDFVCAICSTERVTHIAVGPCDHAICSLCALRVRVKANDRSCVMCKANLPLMLVGYAHGAKGETATFGSLAASLSLPLQSAEWEADTLRADAQWDRASAMLYVHCKPHYLANCNTQSIHCCCAVTTQPSLTTSSHNDNDNATQCVRECGRRFGSVPALVRHMQSTHDGRTLCALCVANRLLFLHEHEVFASAAALKRHFTGKTLPNDVLNCTTQYTTGHPKCELCEEQVFDATALYQHLQRTHLTCSLCDASQMFRFYRDATALRAHHERDHFLCVLCERALSGAAQRERENVLCAFAHYEEFRVHMRDWHGERDCRRFLQPSHSSHTLSHTQSHSHTHPRGAARQSAPQREFFDLDLGAANPVAVARGRQQQQQAHNTLGVGSGGRGGTSSTTRAGVRGGTEELLNSLVERIPANMRIAGRVSGGGTFFALDRETAALQRTVDEERERRAAARQGGAHTTTPHNAFIQETTSQRLRETAFPALSLTAEREKERETVESPALHPLSLVGKRAVASATPSAVSDTPQNALTQDITTQDDEEEKERERVRESRRAQLAEAFGVSLHTHTLLSPSYNVPSQPHTPHILSVTQIQQLRDALGALRFSPLTLLTVPLIPHALCMWATQHPHTIHRLETQILPVLSKPLDRPQSVHCGARPVRERCMTHLFARYYDALSVEYDRDPHCSVTLVFSPQSRALTCNLSKVVGQGSGVVSLRERESERERVPIGGLMPFVSVRNNAFFAACERERERDRERETEREPATVYLSLSDEVVSLWGRPLDRASHNALSHSLSLIPPPSLSLSPAALLLTLRDLCERDERVPLHALVERVCSAGPNAVAIACESLSAAQCVLRVCQREIARCVALHSATQPSHTMSLPPTQQQSLYQSDVWRFLRVHTDFDTQPAATERARERERDRAAAAQREYDEEGFVLVRRERVRPAAADEDESETEGDRDRESDRESERPRQSDLYVGDAWDDDDEPHNALSQAAALTAAVRERCVGSATASGALGRESVCENWEEVDEEEGERDTAEGVLPEETQRIYENTPEEEEAQRNTVVEKETQRISDITSSDVQSTWRGGAAEAAKDDEWRAFLSERRAAEPYRPTLRTAEERERQREQEKEQEKAREIEKKREAAKAAAKKKAIEKPVAKKQPANVFALLDSSESEDED